jgi:hypothetical protein
MARLQATGKLRKISAIIIGLWLVLVAPDNEALSYPLEFDTGSSRLELTGGILHEFDGVQQASSQSMTVSSSLCSTDGTSDNLTLCNGSFLYLSDLRLSGSYVIRDFIVWDWNLELGSDLTGIYFSSRMQWDAPSTDWHSWGNIRCIASEFLCDLAGYDLGDNLYDVLSTYSLPDFRIDPNDIVVLPEDEDGRFCFCVTVMSRPISAALEEPFGIERPAGGSSGGATLLLAIPEPSTSGMLLLALACCGIARRRSQQNE